MDRARLYPWISLILSVAILLGTGIFLAACWKDLPAQIPNHVSFSGEVNGWGGKGMLWVFPGLGLATVILLTVVGFFPQTWNPGVKITPANRDRVFRLMGELLADLRIGSAVLFSAVTVWIVRLASGPGWVFTLLIAVSLTVPILRYFLRMYVFKG